MELDEQNKISVNLPSKIIFDVNDVLKRLNTGVIYEDLPAIGLLIALLGTFTKRERDRTIRYIIDFFEERDQSNNE